MRKKLLTITLAVMVAVSCMPTMAFATADQLPDADAHKYPVTVNFDKTADVYYVTAKSIATANAKTMKYIEVTQEPTHSEVGFCNITCKEELCGEVLKGVVIQIAGHDSVQSKRDMSLEDYAATMLAQKTSTVTGTNLDTAASFYNQAQANVWVQKAYAAGYCRIVNANVCSCGFVSGGTLTLHPANSGLKDAVCEYCGQTVETAHVHPATGSNWATKTDVTPACAEYKYYTVKCATCTDTYTVVDVTRPIATPTAPHNYGTAVTASDATSLNASGKLVVKAGYFAVWTADTTTNVAFGAVFGADTAIAQADATKYAFYAASKATAASCAEPGTAGTYTLKCQTCGKVGGTYTATPKHDLEKVEVAATCTRPAFTVKVCKNCGWADTTTIEVSDVAASHDYVLTHVAATACADEYYVVTCKNCKFRKVIVRDNIASPAKDGSGEVAVSGSGSKTVYASFAAKPENVAHKYGKLELLKAATCEQGELWGYKCTVCGKIKCGTDAFEVKGKATDHNYEVFTTINNCTYKNFVVKCCADCGAWADIDYKTAEYLGGTCKEDTWVVVKEATAFEEGIKALGCSKCGSPIYTWNGHADYAFDHIYNFGYKSVTPIAKVAAAKATAKAGKGKVTVTVKKVAGATGYTINGKAAKVGKNVVKVKKGTKKIVVKATAEGFDPITLLNRSYKVK